ncbi:MAG: Rieske (2Fe-2S) protein [Saprospiraceae bacterium]|nr:Rieske (2Fe-2S) protein [Saprospiraceae bacterium]
MARGRGFVPPSLAVLQELCLRFPYYGSRQDSGQKSDLAEHPFVLIQPANLPAPIYLTKLENDEYSALLLQCTHRGCEVRPAAKELQCPCHGSVFSNTGEVLESPAERPLRRFQVIEDGENLYIK